MAPWVMHLRVAQIIKSELQIPHETDFYVGAVAPDSGRMIGDFEYLPPKDVSHWKREGMSDAERLDMNAGVLRDYYFRESDPARRAFFLGYYVHIVTDTLFVRDVIRPYIKANGRAVWQARINDIRATWYDIDFRFVEKNRGFRPLALLAGVRDYPNDYFNYFSRDDITERVKHINSLYGGCKSSPGLEYVAIDVPGADAFVVRAAGEICALLKDKLQLNDN